MKINKILLTGVALLSVSSCSGQTPDITKVTENGYGIYEDEDGNHYEGNFKDSLYDGYGELELANGDVYKGNFKEGLYSGYGVMEYSNTTVYSGTWEDGMWEGSCKIIWDSGCVYVGEAHENLMHGMGYMIWPMGDYYIGEWRNGNPNGSGTKYYLVDATAEFTHQQYNIYTGDMVNNLKVGHGIMRYSFGALYDGQWENDVRQGQGIVYWENNPEIEFIKFEGTFVNDWINGHGTMYYRDGRIITGTWEGTNLISEDA